MTTGFKGFLEIPFGCTINTWTILSADAGTPTSGDIVIDIWKDTYANFPPVVGDSMVGAGTKPNIAATNNKGQAAPSSWTTTSIAAGDVIGFNIDSVTSLKTVVISLKITKT